jgi:hypothetical protein
MKEYINTYKNQYSTLWNFENKTIKKWDSTVEEEFFERYILGKAKFQTELFEESIKNKKKET